MRLRMKTRFNQLHFDPFERAFLLLAEGDEPPPAAGGETPPAETPPAETPPALGIEPTTVDVDFAALADEMNAETMGGDDETPPVETPPEGTPPTPPAETPPAETPPAPPKEPETPPAEGVKPGEETPPVEPPKAEETPPKETPPQETAPEPLTPEKIQEAFRAYEEQVLPELEAIYKLTDEQAEALAENPAEVLPRFAARVQYQAQIAAYTGVMSQLPQMVMQVLVHQRSQQAAEDAFYGRWPELKNSELTPKVDATLKAYRQANPHATLQEMIDQAGVMAMLSVGLDPRTPQETPPEPPAPAPTPPVRPAGTGGSGAPRTPGQAGGNVFETMAQELIEEGL